MPVKGVPGAIGCLVKKRVSRYRICQSETMLWFSYLILMYSITWFTVHLVKPVARCGLFLGYLVQGSHRVKIGIRVVVQSMLGTVILPAILSISCCYTSIKCDVKRTQMTLQSTSQCSLAYIHVFQIVLMHFWNPISFLNYHAIGQVNQKTWVNKGRAHSIYIASSKELSSLHT